MSGIITYGPAARINLGDFEADSRRFRAERVGDRVMVSYEQDPAGMRGAALALTLDGATVVDTHWYSTWVGASADERAAILNPVLDLIADHTAPGR